MHKESLNKSDAERKVLDDVRAKAPLQQKRRTDAVAAAARKAAADSSDKTSSSSSPQAPVTSPLKHSASSPDRVKVVVILIKISVQLHKKQGMYVRARRAVCQLLLILLHVIIPRHRFPMPGDKYPFDNRTC